MRHGVDMAQDRPGRLECHDGEHDQADKRGLPSRQRALRHAHTLEGSSAVRSCLSFAVVALLRIQSPVLAGETLDRSENECFIYRTDLGFPFLHNSLRPWQRQPMRARRASPEEKAELWPS